MGNIIITGGTGFVGGHVWKFLGKLGYNIENLSSKQFMNEDWKLLDKDVEVVIHCAWPKKDLHSTEHLEFAEMSCNFFNECQKRGIRVINIGSSSEYGVKYEPMHEEMMCEPHTAYGIAKLSTTLYAKKLGFNTLRIFSAWGKGGSNFKSLFKDVDKWGHHKDVRHYIPVEDIAKAVERMLHAKHLYGEIINLAGEYMVQSNMRVSIIDSSDIEASKLENSKWNTYPQNQYERSYWTADLTKMKKLLNL